MCAFVLPTKSQTYDSITSEYSATGGDTIVRLGSETIKMNGSMRQVARGAFEPGFFTRRVGSAVVTFTTTNQDITKALNGGGGVCKCHFCHRDFELVPGSHTGFIPVRRDQLKDGSYVYCAGEGIFCNLVHAYAYFHQHIVNDATRDVYGTDIRYRETETLFRCLARTCGMTEIPDLPKITLCESYGGPLSDEAYHSSSYNLKPTGNLLFRPGHSMYVDNPVKNTIYQMMS